MTTHVYRIEADHDHTAHVQSDIDRYGQDDEGRVGEMWREEIEKIDRGEWSAYGVTAIPVCECCNQPNESEAVSLWGCVVETPDAEGVYADAADIPDDYLREVALENAREAQV